MSSRDRTILTPSHALVVANMTTPSSRSVPETHADAGLHSNHPPEHPLWMTLEQMHLTFGARGGVRAVMAPPVLKLSEKPLLISGFLTPLDNRTSYRHFLLSRYSQTCPCCPPGGPSDVIEIYTKSSIAPTQNMVVMCGMFHVQDDMAKGRFYHLTDANLEQA